MENNYKKLLCAISIIAIVVVIIQLEEAFSLNSIVDNTNPTVIEEEKEEQTNESKFDKGLNTNSQIKTISLSKSNSDNNNNNNKKFNINSNLTVFEGEPINLQPLIANAIAIPANSLIYSWNQIEGPKINIAEESKKNKILNFMAPNRPTDTKYAFELKVVQKTPNGNIDFGKDIINILVIDTNKVAKGASMNIPQSSSSSSPSSTPIPGQSEQSAPSASLPNVPTKNSQGDIVVQGGGQFNPNFRD